MTKDQRELLSRLLKKEPPWWWTKDKAQLVIDDIVNKKHRPRERKSSKPWPDNSWWWLTLAVNRSRCSECREPIARGQEIVYRFEPETVLCVICCDRENIVPNMSKRYKAARRSASSEAT